MNAATVPLSARDAAALLRSGAATIAAEVRGLPEPLRRWHPADGEWCVKEVLGHLIEAERRGFGGRIRIILASERPALERWDQAAVAKARKDCDADADALVGELLRMREDGAAMIAALRPEDFERVGRHPVVGDLTVRDVLQEWVHHDRNHLKQMLSNVQAYAWPHMGNAQKFSAP
jgi:DinB superfamily